jgi:hypothetical protein
MYITLIFSKPCGIAKFSRHDELDYFLVSPRQLWRESTGLMRLRAERPPERLGVSAFVTQLFSRVGSVLIGGSTGVHEHKYHRLLMSRIIAATCDIWL